MENQKEISVFYDGLCVVCSQEIKHYKTLAGAERIRFVDICAPDFDASVEGVNPRYVHQVMHVRRQDGSLVTEVDAFIEIWQTLPRYHFLARWAKKSWCRPFLNLGYDGFAALRPYLPRYKAANCNESPYCEMGKKK